MDEAATTIVRAIRECIEVCNPTDPTRITWNVDKSTLLDEEREFIESLEKSIMAYKEEVRKNQPTVEMMFRIY